MRLFRKPKPEIFTCEICKHEGARRSGIWDYCPKGHTYVGKRVEEN